MRPPASGAQHQSPTPSRQAAARGIRRARPVGHVPSLGPLACVDELFIMNRVLVVVCFGSVAQPVIGFFFRERATRETGASLLLPES